MSYMIDPKEDGGGGGIAKAGMHTLVALGYRRRTSMAGNKMIETKFVCVEDDNGGGDVGKSCFELFVLMDSAKFKLANYCAASEWSERFDALNDNDVTKVLMHSPVKAMIKISQYENKDGDMKDRPEIDWYETKEGGFDDAWRSIVARASDNYQDWVTSQTDGNLGIVFGKVAAAAAGDDPTAAPDMGDEEIPF